MRRHIILSALFLVLGSIFSSYLKSENISVASEKSDVYKRIKQAVDDIWIINTHEHLMMEEARIEKKTDLFNFLTSGGYTGIDLAVSGMSGEDKSYVNNSKNPLSERWARLRPHWNNIKNTGYAQCNIAAVKGLYGIDDINDYTYEEINEKMIASNKKGLYKHVLRDKGRIDVSILDVLKGSSAGTENITGEYFVRVGRFDDFVMINEENIKGIEEYLNVRILSLNYLIEALDAAFQKSLREEKIIGIKSGLANRRIIQYEDVPKIEAEIVFNKMFSTRKEVTAEEEKKLQDFMMHRVIQNAIKYDLPIQIHTGLLASWYSENPIFNTNAKHLVNLFLKYKDAKFDIFHGSYPYMNELGALAKNLPNVYINMCWMHIISPMASRMYLEEWLDTVPHNKIFAFGGDCGMVEGTYGHLQIAKRNIVEVLTKKVMEGYYSEEQAISIAKKILRENVLDLFKIKKVGNRYVKAE